MNSNWSRWIFASISKHFASGKGDLTNFHIQGTILNNQDGIERGEFRWTGANFTENTKGCWLGEFTISTLITIPLGSGDNHRAQRLTGRFAELATQSIIIKKYGPDDELDDGSQLGCLLLKGKVRTYDWGQITPDVKVTQSSVECDYSIDLVEN